MCSYTQFKIHTNFAYLHTNRNAMTEDIIVRIFTQSRQAKHQPRVVHNSWIPPQEQCIYKAMCGQNGNDLDHIIRFSFHNKSHFFTIFFAQKQWIPLYFLQLITVHVIPCDATFTGNCRDLIIRYELISLLSYSKNLSGENFQLFLVWNCLKMIQPRKICTIICLKKI